MSVCAPSAALILGCTYLVLINSDAPLSINGSSKKKYMLDMFTPLLPPPLHSISKSA